MGKFGDVVPGKGGVTTGWVKSRAHTMKEAVPESKRMATSRANSFGSKERMSDKHNQGARGKDNTLRNCGQALGSHTRTFNRGIPDVAPAPINYSGKQKSKELGK